MFDLLTRCLIVFSGNRYIRSQCRRSSLTYGLGAINKHSTQVSDTQCC